MYLNIFGTLPCGVPDARLKFCFTTLFSYSYTNITLLWAFSWLCKTNKSVWWGCSKILSSCWELQWLGNDTVVAIAKEIYSWRAQQLFWLHILHVWKCGGSKLGPSVVGLIRCSGYQLKYALVKKSKACEAGECPIFRFRLSLLQCWEDEEQYMRFSYTLSDL